MERVAVAPRPLSHLSSSALPFALKVRIEPLSKKSTKEQLKEDPNKMQTQHKEKGTAAPRCSYVKQKSDNESRVVSVDFSDAFPLLFYLL